MSAETSTPTQSTSCRFPDCGRKLKVVSKQLCQAHYNQERKGLALTKLRNTYRPGQPCRISMCLHLAFADRVCRAHYARRMRGVDNWDQRPIKAKQINGLVPIKNLRLNKPAFLFIQEYAELRGLSIHECIKEIIFKWHAQRLTSKATPLMATAWDRSMNDGNYEE